MKTAQLREPGSCSLDQTPDSIDLTKSPVKHTNTQRHIEKINEDTSDDDTDEMITFDDDKVKKDL